MLENSDSTEPNGSPAHNGDSLHATSALKREAFIPLRQRDLGETLARTTGLSSEDGAKFQRFCRLVRALVHGHLENTLEELKEAYAPFDPDADTRAGAAISDEERSLRREVLFEEFGRLLARANFCRLAEAQINAALEDRSHWGLHLTVDFTLFDRLELYYRGDRLGTRYRRAWRNRFRTEAIEVPIYQRLVLIFHLKPGQKYSKVLDTDDVYLKLFKDIPKLDLDMLLPGSQVKMSLFDRARVALPTLSGIGIVLYKLIWATAMAFGSTLAFLGLVGGTVGYGVRSLYGYLNTRQKYQLNLTQSLYYQNIDNNAGVIHRLLDEAAEQENREVMLAYFFLWRNAPAEGLTAEALDARIENWLQSEAEQAVNFEIADALGKLMQFRLAEQSGQLWRALPVDDAILKLEEHWREMPEAWGRQHAAANNPSGSSP
jgi:hypothetical protein